MATLERADRAIKVVGEKKAFLLVYYGSDAAGGWQRINVPLRTLTTFGSICLRQTDERRPQDANAQVPEIKCAMGFPSDYRLEHGTRGKRSNCSEMQSVPR